MPTENRQPEALFVGVIRMPNNAWGLRVAFPLNVDGSSIPRSGFLKANMAPPSEKTQIRHIEAWTNPANWSNPVLQAIVFEHSANTNPANIQLVNKGISANPSQLEAVRLGASQSALALIKGPPGTGKTTVIVEVIRQLAAKRQKILVCSQTHQAVRNVMEKLDVQPDIRMIRHGREENLSELEQKYLSGGASQPSWQKAMDKAELSLANAEKEYESKAGPLLLLEKARDAATCLKDFRDWHADAIKQLDQVVAQDLRAIEENTQRQCALLKAAAAKYVAGQDSRKSNLQSELAWIQRMVDACVRRAKTLPSCNISKPAEPCQETCDTEAADHVIGRRACDIIHVCLLHQRRVINLTEDFKQIKTYLSEIKGKRTTQEQAAQQEYDKLTSIIKKETQKQITDVHRETKKERQTLAERCKLAIEKLKSEFGVVLQPLESSIVQLQKQSSPLKAALNQAKNEAERYRNLYFAETEKSPSEKNNPIFWGRLIPDSLANADLLQARFAEKWKTAKSNEVLLNPIVTKLAKLKGQREQNEQQTNTNIDQETNKHEAALKKLNTKERQDIAKIVNDSDIRLRLADQGCADAKANIRKEYQENRGSKTQELSALMKLLNGERALLDLLEQRRIRLMVRINNPNRFKDIKLPRSPEGDLPDCKAPHSEKQMRGNEVARELQRLDLAKKDCERWLVDVEKQRAKFRKQLEVDLKQLEVCRVRKQNIVTNERVSEVARLASVLGAESNRCHAIQDGAIAVAASLEAGANLTNNEPPESWELLASGLRPPLEPWRRKLDFLRCWRKDLSSKEEEINRLHHDQIDVFLSTCVGVGSWRDLVKLGRDAVDLVIIDEAAHATAPETIMPMLYGRRTLLIGDEMQLPPINSHKLDMPNEDWLPYEAIKAGTSLPALPGRLADDWFERSLFEWLYRIRPAVPRVMLNKQFRMHPDIADFIGSVFYPEGLENGVEAKDRILRFAEFTKPICMISTSNDRDNVEKIHKSGENERAQSYSNLLEARLVERVVKKAAEIIAEPVSLGVITPYAPQKELIRHHLKNIQTTRYLDLDVEDVGSVDSYQGSERDIIIVSFVRSPCDCDRCQGKSPSEATRCSKCKGRGFIGSGLKFVHDLRRLNVAFSRARKMLILIGNINALTDPKYGGTIEGQTVLKQFASYVQNKGKVLHVWEDKNGF